MKIYTVVVTIGRNIGDKPMAGPVWRQFMIAITMTLRACKANIIQHPKYTDDGGQVGVWEGSTEDAATLVAFVDECYLPALRNVLTTDAANYKQQAIGFIAVAGTDHLIAPYAL